MRQLAYIILGVVLLASFIQPLTEMADTCRKKVMISSALNNAFRAARDRSLTEESIQNLDAEIDIERFYDYFSDAFCDSLDLYEIGRSEGIFGSIEFESSGELFNPIEVEIDLDEYEDYALGKEVTKVTLHVETDYKFDIGYLKMLNDASYDRYILEFNRTYILSVKN